MIGLDFWSTTITMIMGGVSGFLIYYHFSKIVLISIKHIKPSAKKYLPQNIQKSISAFLQKRREKKKKRKLFTRRNRMLVKFGNNYGMLSLIVLTPILVSLILGAFLLRKYYGHRPEAVPLMILSIVVEGFMLVAGYWYLVVS